MSELSAVLTVAQLARLANVSRYEMARILLKTGVPLQRVGRRRRVFLADLKLVMPILWESIREFHRIGPR